MKSMKCRLFEMLASRYMSSAYFTATDLAYFLDVKLASLSSLLCKLADEGILEKLDNVGPRGGYGYRLNWNHEEVKKLLK
jgi:predicted transcriptional regulator